MPKKPKVRGAKTVAQMRAKLKRTRARSSKTGRTVTKAYAKKHPATTQIETVKVKTAGPFVGKFGFDTALKALKQGLTVRRAVWHQKVHLKMPNSMCIQMTNGLVGHTRVWPVSMLDVLRDDWEVVS